MKNFSIEERRKMILEGNIVRTILKLSFPTIIMSIIVAFIPFTDGLFLNNFASVNIASAVGFSQPYINVLNGFSMGLGVAAMAMIGQANGLGDTNRVKHISLQVFTFGMIFGVSLIPFSILMAFIAKSLVTVKISNIVFTYIALNTISLPMLFMASIFNAMKNATGEPEATLKRVTILLILKCLFNSIFLAWLHLGIIGAVSGTILSYIILSFWMYYDIFIKKSETKLTFKNFKFDKKVIKQLLITAFPSMISFTFVYIGFVLINLEIVKYGVEIINAQAIASNVNSLCFALPSSIGTTITVMVGMNIGANNPKKAKQSLYVGCIISIIIAIIMILIISPNTKHIVRLFNNKNQNIIDVATYALNIYTLSIIGFGIFMVVQGAFVGLGRTKAPLFFGILRIWLMRYIFILITEVHLHENAVFWGNLFSNYISAILFFIFIHMISWKSSLKNIEK